MDNELKPINSNNKFTNEDLKTMQSWDLDRKIAVSSTRIAEFFTKFPNEIYVSFSGGKDSTVLLHLVRRLYPDTPAVFVDTGLEYPELREFVKTIDNVIWLKPKMNFKKVIENYGYPAISKEQAQYISEYRTTKSEKLKDIRWNGNKWGRGKISKKWRFLIDAPFLITHKCCFVMKKNPSKKFEKESGLHPIVGTMACESQNRTSDWKRNGCNAFNTKRPISKPLSFWTEQDIFEYIKRYNLQYASVYGDIIKNEQGKYCTTKCDRTGCVFCLFGIQDEPEPNRFQRLKETHPKLYEYCLKPWDKGGLGMKEVLDFLHIKY